jgi:23S rRNA pseudouridine955/2504/2580 synthase/23S rRNA pseudouridine1911/1915/1917 synthase
VLVLAQTLHAQRVLSKQFKERQVRKRYFALVHGHPIDNQGLIDAPLAPHPKIANRMMVARKKGRPSQTEWRVVERFRWIALVQCLPRTGRQHQIRVHLAHAGMPLLVDELYGQADRFYLSSVKQGYRPSAGREERPLIARLKLHAEAITFQHPLSEKTVTVEAPLPKDFRATLNQLRKWYT